jgi:hypothetical protein
MNLLIIHTFLEFFPISSSLIITFLQPYLQTLPQKPAYYHTDNDFITGIFYHFIMGIGLLFALITKESVWTFLNPTEIRKFFIISMPTFIGGIYFLLIKKNPEDQRHELENHTARMQRYRESTFCILSALGKLLFITHINPLAALNVCVFFLSTKIIYVLFVFILSFLYCCSPEICSVFNNCMLFNEEWLLILFGLLQTGAGFMPGLSRLGSTVTFLIFWNFTLEEAYLFSFRYSIALLIIPFLVLSIKKAQKIIKIIRIIKKSSIFSSFLLSFCLFSVILHHPLVGSVFFITGCMARVFIGGWMDRKKLFKKSS